MVEKEIEKCEYVITIFMTFGRHSDDILLWGIQDSHDDNHGRKVYDATSLESSSVLALMVANRLWGNWRNRDKCDPLYAVALHAHHFFSGVVYSRGAVHYCSYSQMPETLAQ